jgi:CheY-like chemotaxis protein/HD-like signal output (HDOD) protein
MKKKRILFVEDQPIFREPIAKALESRGYLVSTAEDGRDALQTLEMQLPDLVLLDIAMPKVDGMIVLARIRGNPDWQFLPIIVLTAVADQKVLNDAKALGADGVLLKGEFSLNQLFTSIESALTLFEDGHPGRSPAGRVVRAAGGEFKKVSSVTLGREGAALQRAQSNLTADSVEPVQLVRTDADRPTSTAPKLYRREETLEHLLQFRTSHPLDAQTADLLHLSLQEDATAGEGIGFLFKKYPNLLQRVLAAANSGLFSPAPDSFPTIVQATAELGIAMIRGLMLACGLIDLHTPNGSEAATVTDFWIRALTVSGVMGKLVYRPTSEDCERMLLTGLSHEIIDLFLMLQFPRDQKQVIDLARRSEASLSLVREKVFGVPDSELLTASLAETPLPNQVINPVREYLHFERTSSPPTSVGGRLLILAKYIANGLAVTPFALDAVKPVLKEEYAASMEISPPAPEELEHIKPAVARAAAALVHSSASPSRSFEPAARKKILYVRSGEFALLDPVLLALRSFADTDDKLSMPHSADQLEGYQGLVVCVPNVDHEMFTVFHCQHLLGGIENPHFRLLYLAGDEKEQTTQSDPRMLTLQYPIRMHRLRHSLLGSETSAER